MYGHTHSKSMDQPGKVANVARGHSIIVLCVLFPFILDVKFVWVYQPKSHRRRSHKISHTPPFYDTCLHFSRERFSRSFRSSTVKSKFVYDLIVPHSVFLPNYSGHQVRWTYQPGHTGGRSHKISHAPSFGGACLNFSREKDSAIPFPCRP